MKNTLSGLVQFALDFLPGRFPVVRWRGRSRNTHQPAALLVVGRSPFVNHLPEQFFAESPTRENIGMCSLFTLRRTMERLAPTVDLTILRIHRWVLDRFHPAARLRIPEWIATQAVLPADLAGWLAAVGQRRADQKRMRYNRLTTSVSHAATDFERFYHEMYVPFLRNRHGAQAVVRSWQCLRRGFDRGGLIWVHRDGETVAGLLYEQDGHTFRPLYLGTPHGDLQPVKLGALAATYVASVHLAHETGCTRLDFSGNRPSLRDGVLRYKSKWDGVVAEKEDSFFEQRVFWDDSSATALDFLGHIAPIFVDRDGLSGLHVLAGDEPPTASTAKRLRSDLWVPGLQRLYLVSPAGWGEPHPPAPSDTVLVSGSHLATALDRASATAPASRRHVPRHPSETD